MTSNIHPLKMSATHFQQRPPKPPAPSQALSLSGLAWFLKRRHL